MDEIVEVARRHNVWVIEDCCHTLGSLCGGRELGTFGDGAFYSFEWGKPVVAGIGGSAIVNNANLLREMRRLYASFKRPSVREALLIDAQYFAYQSILRPSLFWIMRDLYRYLSRTRMIVSSFREEEFKGIESPDYRKRMVNGSRVRLLRKLEDLDRDIAHRHHVVEAYSGVLNGFGCAAKAPGAGDDVAYLRYPVRVREKAKVLDRARECRVEASGMFVSPVHPIGRKALHSVGYEAGSCPEAEQASKSVISFPTHARIRTNVLGRVLSFLRELGNAKLLEDDSMHA
jgi:dTDP-4-amino-4,6-dideoxygalactose transaminase